MSDKFISLDSLKEYNKQMKETYISPLEERSLPIVDETFLSLFRWAKWWLGAFKR